MWVWFEWGSSAQAIAGGLKWFEWVWFETATIGQGSRVKVLPFVWHILFFSLSSFMDHLTLAGKLPPAEPHCTLTPLNFSMYTMEHLEGVQGRRGLVAPPEKSVLTALDMRMEVFGSLVHHALEQVSVHFRVTTLRGCPRNRGFCISTISPELYVMGAAELGHSLLEGKGKPPACHRVHQTSSALLPIVSGCGHYSNI